MTIWISDSDEEMVTACASPEEYIRKLLFLMSFQVEKQFANQFCYVSAFT